MSIKFNRYWKLTRDNYFTDLQHVYVQRSMDN